MQGQVLTPPYENPQGPETGDKRVQHGGAWYDAGRAGCLACTARHTTPPWNRADDLGFVPSQQARVLTEHDDSFDPVRNWSDDRGQGWAAAKRENPRHAHCYRGVFAV